MKEAHIHLKNNHRVQKLVCYWNLYWILLDKRNLLTEWEYIICIHFLLYFNSFLRIEYMTKSLHIRKHRSKRHGSKTKRTIHVSIRRLSSKTNSRSITSNSEQLSNTKTNSNSSSILKSVCTLIDLLPCFNIFSLWYSPMFPNREQILGLIRPIIQRNILKIKIRRKGMFDRFRWNFKLYKFSRIYWRRLSIVMLTSCILFAILTILLTVLLTRSKIDTSKCNINISSYNSSIVTTLI